MKLDDKMHDVEQNFKILSSFGNGGDDSTPIMSMTISDDLKRFAREYMVSYGITDEDKIIGIHPGSNSNQKWKRWPAQYFGELINIIISEWESYVLVFGDHKEDDLIKDILSHVNESSKVNGITDKSLMESAALISLCKVFIGNDSGLLHIAAATNVITFCIAGPTNINKTSPYGSNSYKVHLNLECQFCYNFNTLRFKCSQISQYKCLKELYPKEVYKEIYPVLSQILI